MLATLTALLTRSTTANTKGDRTTASKAQSQSVSATLPAVISARSANEQLHHNRVIRSVRNTQRAYFLTHSSVIR